MRFLGIFFRCTIAFVVFSSLMLGQQSITAAYVPTSVADGGSTVSGYPYAVYVQIANWTAAANAQVFLKIYNGSYNEFMWSSTGVWSNVPVFSSANQPVATLDGSGGWSGWIYAKHNTNLTSTGKVRAVKVVSTSTNLTSASLNFNVMNMSSSGGWIVRAASPAVNKGILAYAGGFVVGSYRTEDNGIVEGYSYGAGGFKIAVPAGIIDSLVTINNDGSQDRVFMGPWSVSAGNETDASTGGGKVGGGSAAFSLPTISGGISHSDLSLILRGQAPDTITNAMVLVPSTWQWSHSSGDLNVSGNGSPVVGVSGDSIMLSALTLAGGDSLQLRFTSLTPPDSTANILFLTQTGSSPDSLFLIAGQPSLCVYSIPRPISLVKENDLSGVSLLSNTLVTVRGIVTAANEFGSPSYLQDNSGGLAVYGPAFSKAVHQGDEVIVSGLVQPFHGLTEIVNPVIHRIVSTGNIVQPIVVTVSEIVGDGQGRIEQYECMLVRINAIRVAGSGTWAGDLNYAMTDASDSDTLRIVAGTNLVGQPIPGSAFDMVGIVGQYALGPPFVGGYQVMPRLTADIFASGPIIATMPIESAITPSSLTVLWSTIDSGTTYIRYGKSISMELGTLGKDALTKDHAVTMTGLDPSAVYYIKAFSARGTDTSFASALIASTASPAQCTGVINVYFNHSFNPAVAWSQPANGNWDLVSQIVGRIDNAQRSIDAALYSLSGSSQGDVIAQALTRAKNRGVRVRVICEHDNRSSSALNNIAYSGIPIIDDAFDPVNAGAGLMHNKFLIVDGRGGAPDSAWVWTGSWNPTQPGTADDYQNAVEIQDQALAGAYTLEFNEMWGSSSEVPNASMSRFGVRKADNTPHRFVIGGRAVECHFSPSDRTTSHLVSVLEGAHHSIAFDILTFTRWDLADAIVSRKNAGVTVRGLMDNDTDQGNQYSYLVSQGIDVHLKIGSGLLHHKYAIIDAESPGWNPITVTGSHNWSSAAESANNENTLLIHDAPIANQFLQEFAARYYQFGGIDSITVGVNSGTPLPPAFSLEQNFPNPFNPTTEIRYQIPASNTVKLSVYDILGREVALLVNELKAPGSYTVQFRGSNLASGVYLYRIEAGRFVRTQKMLLLK